MLTVKYRYVHEDLDRHGNVRLYVQKRGTRKVRIRAAPGTEAFLRAYHDALDVIEGRIKEAPALDAAPRPGTWRWLCAQYFAGAKYRGMSARSKYVRRLILEHTFSELVVKGETEIFANFPLHRMSAKAIRALRDRKMETPEAANNRVKAIRSVFAWAIANDVEGVTTNPARDVTMLQPKNPDGFHTWTVEEVRRFEERHPVGSKARLALALLLYTGVRRSDAVRLGRQMVRDGWLHFREMKGRERTVKDRAVPILPELQAILDGSKDVLGDLAFLVTEFGRPFTSNGFGNWFRKRCNEAGLKHCSAHGLRKAGATIAADEGATEHELMAIYGWETPKQAAKYTKQANRKKLAGRAMRLVVPADVSHHESAVRKSG